MAPVSVDQGPLELLGRDLARVVRIDRPEPPGDVGVHPLGLLSVGVAPIGVVTSPRGTPTVRVGSSGGGGPTASWVASSRLTPWVTPGGSWAAAWVAASGRPGT